MLRSLWGRALLKSVFPLFVRAAYFRSTAVVCAKWKSKFPRKVRFYDLFDYYRFKVSLLFFPRHAQNRREFRGLNYIIYWANIHIIDMELSFYLFSFSSFIIRVFYLLFNRCVFNIFLYQHLKLMVNERLFPQEETEGRRTPKARFGSSANCSNSSQIFGFLLDFIDGCIVLKNAELCQIRRPPEANRRQKSS